MVVYLGDSSNFTDDMNMRNTESITTKLIVKEIADQLSFSKDW